ncbi:MAG: polysaccharide pyruvyl transferase family protein [Verrucomicrobiae bacterium]|nr:polysaccharide pyruvyl transferase family protein [Verrucomicrobiae bacterium]
MIRRHFLTTTLTATLATQIRAADGSPAKKITLRSSWQTVNIGDIAHTPGMLVLLEKYQPQAEITLWPSSVKDGVKELLLARFPKLKIAESREEKLAALHECDFFLHGSGPGIVGKNDMLKAQDAGKPYGFGGITLNDSEIKNDRALLEGAQFVFLRDTQSLEALNASAYSGPKPMFGPDATFAVDLADKPAAEKLLAQHGLEPGKYLCAIPRLRWTPYWEIHHKPINAERDAVNKQFAEQDHAKLREAITSWVRETGMKVFLTPEMSYAVSLLKPLLFDGLPDDVKPEVAMMDRYWLTAEAASTLSMAAAVVSFECHSPILAIGHKVPAVYLRQPTDTRKGQMYRDIGVPQWIHEIEEVEGKDIAATLLKIAADPATANATVTAAHSFAHEKMKAMVEAI